MNSKGQLFTTNLLLWIIIITIILGITVYLISVINDYEVQNSDDYELIQITDNTLDMLVKTEGSPTNWESLSSDKIESPGLKVDNSTDVSYKKLIKLEEDSNLLKKSLPAELKYVLILYPTNNKSNKTIINGNYISNSTNNVQSSSTSVIIDYGYKIYNFSDYNYNNTCPYNEFHNNQFHCIILNVDKSQLNNGNYYLVTRYSQSYKLSNTYNTTLEGITNQYTNINDKLNVLLCNETNDTIFIHVNGNIQDSYLVYDNGNDDNHLDSILNPLVYTLELRVAW